MKATRRSLSAVLLAPMLAPGRAVAEGDVWAVLRQGGAALIRHAIAPGGGDPSGFRRDDCSTQRLLSDEGRAQARAIGEAFRANGIARATVLTSAWCRCRDTATLLDLGAVTHEPALDSFFAERGEGPARTAALRALLAAWPGQRPLVCVTHQVNITSLTRIFPASGEAVVVRTGAAAAEVVGRFRA